MAKLKNVTLTELKVAENQCFELGQIIGDLHRRASQGYADEIPEPLSLANSFVAMSRTLADMSAWFLMKAALDEQRRMIDVQLKTR